MEDWLLLYRIFAGIYFTIAAAEQEVGFKKRLTKGLGRRSLRPGPAPSPQEFSFVIFVSLRVFVSVI